VTYYEHARRPSYLKKDKGQYPGGEPQHYTNVGCYTWSQSTPGITDGRATGRHTNARATRRVLPAF
jgi:hypothetical protein